MYWCNECQQAFDEPTTRREWIGDRENGGYVDFEECPYCGINNFDRALICPECGEYCGELFGHKDNYLCNECVQKAATLKKVIEYGDSDKQSVEINCFLGSVLTVSEIETILTEYLLTDPKTPLMNERIEKSKNEFVEDNKDEFAEWASFREWTIKEVFNDK